MDNINTYNAPSFLNKLNFTNKDYQKMYEKQFPETEENIFNFGEVTILKYEEEKTLPLRGLIDEIKSSQFEIKWCQKDLNRYVVLFSENEELLKETWNSITEYTKKVDPKSPLKEFQINIINNKKSILISEILPRPVTALYGDHPFATNTSNCHGSARVTAGITPLIGRENYYSNSISNEVNFEDLSNGDIVVLNAHSSMDAHSFVFLNHHLSISMNGQGQNLELFPTKAILKYYSTSPKALEDKELFIKENIKIYRKKEDDSYPEEVMKPLIQFYHAKNYLAQYPQDHYYPVLKNAFKEVYDVVQKNPNDKKLELIFKKMVDHVPRSIANEFEI